MSATSKVNIFLENMKNFKLPKNWEEVQPYCTLCNGLIVLAVCIAFWVFQMYFRSWRIRSALHKVPSPEGYLPLFGHALSLKGGRPWHKMARWAWDLDSPMIHFSLGPRDILYVCSPQMLKRVLQSNVKNYRKHRDSYQSFLCLLGNGLVTAEDEEWRKGRLLLSHCVRFEVLEAVPALTKMVALRLFKKALEAGRQTDRKYQALDMAEEFRHMTLQVIGTAVLSLDAEESERVFPDLYLPIVTECNDRVWSPWRQFMPWLKGCREQKRCLRELNNYLTEKLKSRWQLRLQEAAEGRSVECEPPTDGKAKRRTDLRQPDILDRYLSQLTKFGPAEIAQTLDNVRTMVLAGHETSAAGLTWTTFELLCHPEYAQKLRDEYDEVFARTKDSDDELPTFEEAKGLKWAPAVIREALRLHSVVPLVMRYAAKDDVVPASVNGLGQDITIPAGCTVMVGIEGVHGQPKYWGDDTWTYKPERFLNMDDIDQWAFIPFINGPRNCMGQHLSLVEMSVCLSHMFGRFDVSLHSQTVCEAGTKHPYIIPQTPDEGLWCKFTPRAY